MKDRDTPATRAVGAGRSRDFTHNDAIGGGVVNPPVWRGSTILFDSVAAMRASARDEPDRRLQYGRFGGPTQWALADALTALEPGAEGTMLYPSGLAAIAGVLGALLSPGDEILMTDSVYGPTRGLCDRVLARMGVTTRYYDPLVAADGLAALIGPDTRALFLESPGSLTFEVQDVPALAAAARAAGIVSIIDNTWATPLLFRALAHCDVSILACTKYVVGHSDVLMGSASATGDAWTAIRRHARAIGNHVSPDDAALALRGLRTIDVRLRRHGENALEVARWLAAREEVGAVLYPALPGSAGHDLWRRDFAGASGLFAFALPGRSRKSRDALVDALVDRGAGHFGLGYSWGGYESLAIPVDPVRTASETRADGPMVRLHIGLEDPADLIAELARAFDSLRVG